MNGFIIIIALVLAFIAGLFYGKKKASTFEKYSYDSGWNDCMNHYVQNYELIPIDEMLDTLENEQKHQ